MTDSCTYKRGFRLLDAVRNQRGISLLEVLISTVVLGIALVGFLMALSTSTITSRMAIDQGSLVYLAGLEFESLRASEFGRVPFLKTGEVGYVQDVPDYFSDLAISTEFDGVVTVGASYDLPTPGDRFSRHHAFDGKRANENSRWMGKENALAYRGDEGPVTDDPIGGGDPGAGGPSDDPEGGGDNRPKDYQYIYCAFPKLTYISRILYDNRFNMTEILGVPDEDFDYLPHELDIWQRNFDFFWSDGILGVGDVFDPWFQDANPLAFGKNLGYSSSGIHMIYDKPEAPLEAGIIGVYKIDTYADFDKDYHWPYVAEIEIYGYNEATYYLEDWRGEFDNVIMYFPNYLESGFDLGRRTYVIAPDVESVRLGHGDLIRVDLEFHPVAPNPRSEEWQTKTWWQDDDRGIAWFQTSFYRNAPTRVDRLPNLRDFPSHLVFEDNEDFTFPFTVPGASEIRGRLVTVPTDPGDTITPEDAGGNPYPINGDWTDWIQGDTLVIHFKSNDSGNTYDDGYDGFAIDAIEVRWVGLD